LQLELLETRELLSIGPITSSSWTELGPAPIGGIGPATGRITGIAVDNVTGADYITAAGGGVWKSMNGGLTWAPLTFGQPTLVMSAIALAPNGNQPEIIYAATGDIEGNAGFRGYSTYGIGILKSTDGGLTWTLLPGHTNDPNNTDVFNRRTISKIVIDPTSPGTIYAAVYGGGDNGSPGNTGIWKSTDAGATWVNTTASIDFRDSWSDLVIDPSNSQNLYAALATPSGGIYRSTSGGGSWFPAGNFPHNSDVGRISLAISQSSPNTLYAAIADPENSNNVYEVVQTINGNTANPASISWSSIGNFSTFGDQLFHEDGDYTNAIAVDPTNAYHVYVAGYKVWQGVSIGGGFVWAKDPNTPLKIHDDQHVLAFQPPSSATSGGYHLLVGTDGGIYRLDDPNNWVFSDLNGNLDITQFYHVALDPNSATNAYGTAQDNGTSEFTGNLVWTSNECCDVFNVAVSPDQGNSLVYTSGPAGAFERNFAGVNNPLTYGGGYFVVDPNQYPTGQDRLLYSGGGGSTMAESTNSGQNWNKIMVRGWPVDKNGNSTFAVGQFDLSASNPDTIYAIGLNSANDSYSTLVTVDDGQNWAVLAPPPDASVVQPNSSGTSVFKVDPTNDRLVYVVGNDGSVYQGLLTLGSTGTPVNLTWTNIRGSGLPTSPIDGLPASLYAIAVDPIGAQDRVLYVGSDFGVYSSTDDGTTWQRCGNLPNARVSDLETQAYAPGPAGVSASPHILAAGTYGIGMWETAFRVSASLSLPDGKLQIDGDANSDVITVELDPHNPSLMDVWEGGPHNAFDNLVGSFDVAFLKSVTITVQDANNTINIEDTVAGVPVTINLGNGNDTVNISPFGQTLDRIQGNVSINTGVGFDTLNVDDQKAQIALANYSVTSSSIVRGTGIISYGIFKAVNLNAEVSANYNISGTEDFWTTTINTGAGIATVNVLGAGLDGTLNIVGDGGSNADRVNLGDNGSLSGVQSSINIENKAGTNALVVDDSQDPTPAVNVAMGKFGANPDDAERDGDIWGSVGFSNAAADIYYEYNDTRSLTVDTGSGAGTTVEVYDTDPAVAGFQTNIVSHAATTINVGNPTVAGIASTLNLENPPSFDTININDSVDSSVQKVVLSTLGTNPADSEANSDDWGQVSFLGAANINYEYSDTSALNVLTGQGPGTVVNVLATNPDNVNCQTNIIAQVKTTVNVGNAGSGADVQNIASTLNIEDPFAKLVTINVDDSLDPAAHTASLSTIGSNPADSEGNSDAWGEINGLAPANINYEYGDVRSLLIEGGKVGDTFDVANLPPVSTTVSGTGGTNTLNAPNQSNSWTLNAAQGGVLDSKVTFSGFEDLAGGNAGDSFSLSSPAPIAMNLLLNSPGVLNTASGTQTITGAINNNGSSLTVKGAGGTTLKGAISGAGGLNLPGTGTVTLATADSYSGGTVLSGATLAVGNSAALGSGLLTLDSGTFEATVVAVSLANAVKLGGNFNIGGSKNLTFTGAATLTGNRTLTVNNTGPTSFAGAIGQSSNGLGLTKAGTGVLVLSNINTYTGTTTLSAGTLALGNNSALGTGPLVVSAGTLEASGAAVALTNAVTLGGNVTIGGSKNLTFTGAAILTGNRTLTVNNTGITTFAGVIGQSSSGIGLTEAGTGVLVLSNSNTYSGTTFLTAGTLALGNNSALGTGPLVVSAGTLEANGAAVTLANPVTLFGNETIGGSLNLTFTGAVTLTGTPTLTVSNTGTTFFTGAIGQSSSGLGFTKAGTGVLVLSHNNTYSGATTLSAGTLALGNNHALGTGPLVLNAGTLEADGLAVTLANAVTLGGNVTIGGSQNLTFTGAATLTGNRTLTVNNTGTTTFAGAIGQSSNGLTLTKNGAGTLMFSAGNTYTGSTTVSGGTLLVNGSIAGALTVNSGANAGGSGKMGPVTVNSGGTLQPGISASHTAILATGNLALVSGSNFDVALNGTTAGAGGYDQVKVTGTVNVANCGLNVTLGFAAAVGDSFVIIKNNGGGAVVGNFKNLPEGFNFFINGKKFQITYKGGSGHDVVIKRVP
jgi:autotransporter-associated beta strand protein